MLPPALPVCGAFLAGCAIGEEQHDRWPALLILGSVAVVCAVCSRVRAVWIVALSVVALAAGVARVLPPDPAPFDWPTVPTNAVRGIVIDWPTAYGDTMRGRIALVGARTDRGWVGATGTLRVTLPDYPPVARGDVVVIGGTATIRRGWWSDADGTLYGQWHRVERPNRDDAPADVRHRIVARLRDSIERHVREPEASLLVGMLLGEKHAVDDETRAALAATGTTHLIIVDGTNTALVIGLFALVGRWLGIGRRWYWAVGSLAGVGVFAFLAGGDAPVVRATIMGAGALLAPFVGRRSDALVWLAIAAALLVALDPAAVRTLAFQYSFFATFGVVVVGPWLAKQADRLPVFAAHAHIVEVLAITIGAQLMTEPLALHTFGRVSLVSPLVHAFVEPLVPSLLLLALATAVGGLLPVPFVGAVIGIIAALPAWMCLQIVRLGASLPAAAPTLPQLGVRWTVAIYAIPALLLGALRSRSAWTAWWHAARTPRDIAVCAAIFVGVAGTTMAVLALTAARW